MNERIQQGSFGKNTITLVIGNLVAQVITISLVPIITRLYGPQAYGVFSIVMSLAALGMSIANLQYVNTIVLPEEASAAAELKLLSGLVGLITSLIALVGISIWLDELSLLIGMQEYKSMLYFFPVFMFFSAMRHVYETWSLRNHQFAALAKTKILGAAMDRLATLGVALVLFSGPIGLMIGKLFGLISPLLALQSYHRPLVRAKWDRGTLFSILRAAKRYKSFAYYSGSPLIHQLALQAPAFLLAIVFVPEVVGFYALAKRVLIEPIQIVSAAISRTFVLKISELANAQRGMESVTKQLLQSVLTLILYPVFVLVIVAPELFAFVFGEQWRESGVYTQLLAPIFISIFVLRPFTGFFTVFERQKELIRFDLLLLASTLIGLSIGWFFGDVRTTIIGLSIANAVANTHRLVWALALAGLSARVVLMLIVRKIVEALLFCAPIVAGIEVFGDSLLTELGLVLGVTVVYVFYVLNTDAKLRTQLVGLVRR